jgi:hypothetical protein
MPDDDETFRLQIAQALAREPSRAELEVDLVARILRWLRTSDDRLLQPEIWPFAPTNEPAAPVQEPKRTGPQVPPPTGDEDHHRSYLFNDAGESEELSDRE